MEDFKERYREELLYQEIKANKHTLQGYLWFIAGVAFIWLLTIAGFFQVDKMLITIAFVSNCVLFIPVGCIYLKGDLSKAWLKYFILSLICIASSVIIIFLSYHAVLLYVVPLLLAIQYRKSSTIWFVYGVNTVAMLVSSLASFYYGICDLNLLLQSQHVRSWYMEMIEAGAFNIPFNENPIFIIIVFEVFPRSIILFIFSIMMQYTIVGSNEDALRIAQLTYLKETDIKTKVFNKNKYEEMSRKYYPKIDQIAVVFWDLNNLKLINDEYGHAMGDKAIEKLSCALYEHSGQRCCVYRIGGDEFLMIIDNPVRNETENIIKAVKEKLENDNEKDMPKITSAVGMAFGSGSDILKVVERADAAMYKNKRLSREGRK